MTKLLLFFLTSLFCCGPSWSQDTRWYFLNKESGCVALDEGYVAYPYLAGATDPPGLFKLFQEQFSDATIQPFVNVVAKSHESDGTIASPEERMAYKDLTNSNAFVISSVKSGIELAVFTEAACRKFGRLGAK